MLTPLVELRRRWRLWRFRKWEKQYIERRLEQRVNGTTGCHYGAQKPVVFITDD
jgi:hypothetical protein